MCLGRLRRWLPRLRDEAVIHNIADLAAQRLNAYQANHELRRPEAVAWTILRRTAIDVLHFKGSNFEPALAALPPDDRLRAPSAPRRESAESMLLLEQLLRRLSPRERLVYLDRHSGYSSREIAAKFEISEANVDTIYSRAKKKLAALAKPIRPGPDRERKD